MSYLISLVLLAGCGGGFSSFEVAANMKLDVASNTLEGLDQRSNKLLTSEVQIGSFLRENITDKSLTHLAGAPRYNYAPDVIFDSGNYHMYWCAGVGDQGDYVLHAQSTSPSGPFHASTSANANTYDVALKPTWNSADFDGFEACDPSVIKMGNVYYLYYGGLPTKANTVDSQTSIGVATSLDGVHFTRANGGRPIVRPAKTNPNPPSYYGAGQPSVFFRAPYVYMARTDHTGSGANHVNGAGIFLLRSSDPLFLTGVQEFTGSGWADRASGYVTSEYSIVDAFSVDMVYDPASEKVMIASDQDPGLQRIYVLDKDTFQMVGHLSVPGSWFDGPALAKNADHTLFRRPQCSNITITLYKAIDPTNTSNVFNTDITVSQAMFQVDSRVCAEPGEALSSFSMISATSSEQLWPASAAVDGNPGTAYTSSQFATFKNDRGVYLTAFMDGIHAVSRVMLTARMLDGLALGFATNYDVYLTSPIGSGWDYVGNYNATPDGNGVAVIELGRMLDTYGVKVVPKVLGIDDYNNFFFQLAEISLVSTVTSTPPVVKCMITQAKCPRFPGSVGTFEDVWGEQNFDFAKNPDACLERASDYYNWCGGAAEMTGATTTARFESISLGVSRAVTVGNSCEMTISSCPNHPSVTGTFEDVAGDQGLGANSSANACKQRTADYYSWCGIPADGHEVVSQFKIGGQVAAIGRVGDCQIQQDFCVNSPSTSGVFEDLWGDLNTDASTNPLACMQRAADYHNWCGNPNSVLTRATYFVNGQPVQSTQIGSKIEMSSAASNDEIWPAANAVDRDNGSVYTSQSFASSANDRGTYLAAWTNGQQRVSKLVLTARVQNGAVLGFATNYDVYLTAPDNSRWDFVGNFQASVDPRSGITVISLGASRDTYGVLVIPRVLGVDDFNNHFFQLSEMWLAP